jgi:hypothetical protein
MEERHEGPYAPGKSFPRPQGDFSDFEKAQNPGGYSTQDWQKKEGFENIFENLKRDMVDGNDPGIRNWEGEGVEIEMARKAMSFDRLDNLGVNHSVELPNGSVVDVRTLMANLAQKSYAMSGDEKMAMDLLQNDVSWKGEYIPEVKGLSDTATWKNPEVNINSYNAAGDPRIKEIEIPKSHFERLPDWERTIWTDTPRPNWFDTVVLPFVAPLKSKALELKDGTKALLDKIVGKDGRKRIKDDEIFRKGEKNLAKLKAGKPNRIASANDTLDATAPSEKIVIPEGRFDDREAENPKGRRDPLKGKGLLARASAILKAKDAA